MNRKISPLKSDVLLHPIEQPGMSEGGLYLPDAWKKKAVKGIVIKKGDGCIESSITPGDVVLVNAYAGDKVSLADDGIFWIVREADILSKFIGGNSPKLIDTETLGRLIEEVAGEEIQKSGPYAAQILATFADDLISRIDSLTHNEGMEF